MGVITISRQMGSLGHQIAEEIARCLHYKVVWREVINDAALRAGVPEVALATIDELDFLGLRPSVAARTAYHDAVRVIIRELAAHGNVVIVGRAGQVILRGMNGVLHVRLYAPLPLRVDRIAERHEISVPIAQAQVEASDKARTRYLKRYYHARWDDPNLYDLMINTADLLPNMVAEIVCCAVASKQKS
jgi:cytidylate kinase